MGSSSRPRTTRDFRRNSAGALPQQPFPFESVQPPIAGRTAASPGSPNGDDLGHGAVPVEDYDSSSGANVIEVTAELIPQLGYLSHSHMAIMALTDLLSSDQARHRYELGRAMP